MSEALDPAVAEAVERGKLVADRLINESRLVGAFDALYEVGGVQPCLKIITVLTERLAERMRREAALAAVPKRDSGWVA